MIKLIIISIIIHSAMSYTFNKYNSMKSKSIAEINYKNEPIQRFVATHLGDILPKMRDTLINLKKAGYNEIERHIYAWSIKDNWTPNIDLKK